MGARGTVGGENGRLLLAYSYPVKKGQMGAFMCKARKRNGVAKAILGQGRCEGGLVITDSNNVCRNRIDCNSL